MKIVVLMKQVPDTWGERKLDTATGVSDRAATDAVIDEIGERALEVALTFRDANKGTEVVVVSMGPATVTAALRKGLSMGADSAIHVLDDKLAGADAWLTSKVLSAVVARTGCDIAVAGNESTDGRGGVVPAMIAEHLGLAHLSFLNEVILTDTEVRGTRSSETGSLQVHAALPAIISITEALPEARFPNFKGILTAKKKPLEVLSLADLGLDADGTDNGRSVVVSTVQRPARTAGTKTTDEGNAGVELAEFLVAGRLI